MLDFCNYFDLLWLLKAHEGAIVGIDGCFFLNQFMRNKNSLYILIFVLLYLQDCNELS